MMGNILRCTVAMKPVHFVHFAQVSYFVYFLQLHGRIQRRGGGRGSGPLLKKHNNIGLPSNIDPDPIKIAKATKPAFNGGPLSARQRNAIRPRADDGPPFSGISIISPSHQLKKNTSVLDPSDKTFWIRACAVTSTLSIQRH